MSEWIPVTERLPEEDYCTGRGVQYSASVLVTVIHHSNDDDVFVDMACTADGEWQLTYPQDDNPLIPKWCEVIAWMPLPKPYGERKEGECAPSIDAVEVVRCRECKWYDPPHILYKDGTRKNVEKDELTVTADVGINCGGKCMAHSKTYCTNHDREDPEDEQNIVIFRNPMDYCSYGERRTDE